MGGTESSYAAKDWFEKAGSTIGDIFGKITDVFGALLQTGMGFLKSASSIASSPIMLIGIGCVALYIVTQSKGGGRIR